MGIFYYESAYCIFILYAYGPIQSRRSKKRQEINPLTDLIISHLDPFALEGGVSGCTIGKNIVSIPSRVGVP